MGLYLESGYANMHDIMNKDDTFVFVIGPRGSGKTYGALLEILESGKKFIKDLGVLFSQVLLYLLYHAFPLVTVLILVIQREVGQGGDNVLEIAHTLAKEDLLGSGAHVFPDKGLEGFFSKADEIAAILGADREAARNLLGEGSLYAFSNGF